MQGLQIKWTPTKAAYGYLHVVLTTPDVIIEPDTGKAVISYDNNGKAVYGGGNLNTSNDQGYLLVGIYDPKNIVTSAPMLGAQKSMGAKGGKSLKIVSDSLKVRPIKDRTIGDATTVMETGKNAVVEAELRFDDETGVMASALADINVYLRENNRVVGHKVIPLLSNGKGYIVRIPYTTPKTARLVPLDMIISSGDLPVTADNYPHARRVKAVLKIN